MPSERRGFSLRLLGGCSLEGPTGLVTGRAVQRRRLATLAAIAAGGRAGAERDRLIALLWPESTVEQARHRLADTLHVLRATLGDDALRNSGDRVALNADVVACDLLRFDEALAADAVDAAVAAYGGPFLDGFHVADAPEFERWTDAERERVARQAGRAFEALAERAAAAGDHAAAVAWWRRLASHDPYSSRVLLRLMRALDAAGDRAGAVRQAGIHATLLREEIGAAPDAEVAALAERLRSAPPVGIDATAVDVGPEARAQTLAPALTPAPTAATADAAVGAGVGAVEAATPLPTAHVTWHRRPLGGDPPSRILALGVMAALGLLVLASGAWRSGGARAPEAAGVDARIVAVAPFRTGGADAALGYLREGMLDLLAAKLTGDGGPRATEPRTLLDAWRRAGGGETADLPERAALAVARDLGAGRLLLGSAVGTPRRLVLTASLLAVPGGAVRADATVEGPQDSLTALVDRLAAQLLVRDAGEGDRLAPLVRAPLPALHAYLAGQAAHRRGLHAEAVAQFERALDVDSTFGLAALGLTVSAGAVSELNDRLPRAWALAWAARRDLSPRDDALLRALLRPGYPERRLALSTRESLTAWERARDAAPDRAEPWYAIGDLLFHFGATLDAAESRRRAAAAFDRALALDSAFTPAVDHLLQLALLEQDTAAVRRHARLYFARDSLGDNAQFLRWHVALVLGDGPRLAAIRAAMDTLGSGVLGRIIGYAIQIAPQHPDALADADRAAAVLRLRPPGPMSQQATGLDINRGRFRPMVADSARCARGCRVLRQAHITIALGSPADADTSSAAAAAAALAGHADAPLASEPAEREQQVREMCLVQQWRLSRGDTRTARRAIREVAALARSADSLAAGPDASICAAALEAILATAEKRPDARAAVHRLDRVLRREGQFLGYGPFAVAAPTLVAARLLAAHGDLPAALAATRRRSYHPMFGPLFLASELREEGRLAAAVGDTAGALRAYGHYLALRTDPRPELRAEAGRIRAEYARLARATVAVAPAVRRPRH